MLGAKNSALGPYARDPSDVVTHSYEANDTSFINIVFLRLAPNIYIYQSIYTFIYSRGRRASEGAQGASRHYDLLFFFGHSAVWLRSFDGPWMDLQNY